MEEFGLEEKSAKQRKAEIEQYRQQEEKILENLTEEQMVEYLVSLYKQNANVIKELNLNSISEDDIK